MKLPIGLHDARISKLQILPASPHKEDGVITFIFENGLTDTRGADIRKTGRATVRFSGVDFDFSHVNYFKENHRIEMGFEDLANALESNESDTFEIIDACYGYNLSIFICSMFASGDWHEMEISISHAHEVLYEWEDLPMRK
jgi:hypothetical protein